MPDSPSEIELLKTSREALQRLQSALVATLPPYEPKPGAKLLRLIDVWHQALMHRLCDLAGSAIALFEQGRLVPACTVTRSFYETVAQLYYFQKKLQSAKGAADLAMLSDFVARGAWGSKDKSTKQEALQVLTAMAHVEKEFPGIQGEYFHLCEYAHPNMKGCIGAYSQIEIPAYEVAFGMNPQGLPLGPFGLGALDIGLELALQFHSRQAGAESVVRSVVGRHATEVFSD